MRSKRQCAPCCTDYRRIGAFAVVLALVALTGAGCVTTNEVSREANNDEEYTKKLNELSEIFETRDVEKVIDLYDQETYSLSFNQEWAFNSNAESHRETLQRVLGGLESLKIELAPDVTVDRADSRVWTTRHFKADAVTKAGREVKISGWHSAIWEERGDRWLIVYEHFNLDPRMTEPPPVAAAPPADAPPPVAAVPPMLKIDDVFFDYDKWDIRADQLATMNVALVYLQAYPETEITIEGHCDERGSTRYNIRLGQRRADTTKAWLVEKGIAPERLRTISFGKSRPFEEGRSEEDWQSNRRSHFVVTKGPNPQEPPAQP